MLYSTDIISPEDANVVEVPLMNHFKEIYLYNDETNSKVNTVPYILHSSVRVKKHVSKGENVCIKPRYFQIPDVIKYKGIDAAIFYLTTILYDIFNSKVVINYKHFEVMVSSMIYYICTEDCGEFKAGLMYTRKQWLRGGGEEYENKFVKTIYGINSAPKMSTNILRGMMFERQSEVITMHLTRSPEDTLETPYVKLSLGRSLSEGGLY